MSLETQIRLWIETVLLLELLSWKLPTLLGLAVEFVFLSSVIGLGSGNRRRFPD